MTEKEPVFTYKVYMNMNQCPGAMVKHFDQWSEGCAMLDGLLGKGAKNPDDPMNVSEIQELMTKFEGKPKILVTQWDTWKGVGKGTNLSKDNLFEHFKEKFHIDAQDLFIWDDSGAWLTTAQLDEIRDSGFQPVLINTRKWGDKQTGEDWTEELKASMEHPWCKGVVIEGNPQALTKPILRLNHRLQIAQHVAKLGKPLYFLQPPAKPQHGEGIPHIEKVKNMLESLHSTLDGLTYPGQVTLIPSLYGVKGLPCLPEMEGGECAHTFTGGMRYLCEHKGC